MDPFRDDSAAVRAAVFEKLSHTGYVGRRRALETLLASDVREPLELDEEGRTPRGCTATAPSRDAGRPRQGWQT